MNSNQRSPRIISEQLNKDNETHALYDDRFSNQVSVNATSRGLVIIERQNGYHTEEKLVT